MKPKRYRQRLTDEQALAIVRAYHTDQATQVQLAEQYGTTKQVINQICHGTSRPHIYRQVEAELGQAPNQAQQKQAVGA